MDDQPLCCALWSKTDEQIERTMHLISLLPAGSSGFQPPHHSWPVALVLGHLLECLAGFCAVLYTADPAGLAHFSELRTLPVNHHCAPDETAARIALYRTRIREGWGHLDDALLARKTPTVFVPGGEAYLTLLLGNLEHLVNHKHQLFTYLKMMGVAVSSEDLYQFRGRS